MTHADLPSRIREAIKEPHGKVNHLNTARIPLCLPPEARTPLLYTLGLLRYAEIYLGLEKVWLAEIGDPIHWIQGTSDNMDPNTSGRERIQTVLRLLYLPELLRTKRFEADFLALQSLDPNISSLGAGKVTAGSQFRQYIEEDLPTKPHLLVAYIWIMYQALFNGGRFIRMQLLKAGPEFWGLSARSMNTAALPVPLSFWHVDEEEVIKASFRSRLNMADKLLTETEREEIIQEAVEILRRCELITLQLDADVHVEMLA
ncbi:heme-binding peroxidase [Aspergillus eucalypticola CBS 122712]|uniref:Heme-binding peroxidase n=1 Tax=Aspergillus eucalypticola (strain CBS 122712 / IBT 29274) TaxID=1448314 RepID=A0A317UKJ2_ASPEC|nr:heme-binding peroxidase [Aspergillus eucalypticola CBS 122712]PWY61658.1 heme-binding peroxidase [Aspergillus eucalypticola CBS 122712]